MLTNNQIIEWKEQDEAKVSISVAPSSSTKNPNTLGGEDALVYAFMLLLSAVHESYHTATTKAKELNAARSQITNLINEQKSLQFHVLTQQANKYYTMIVKTRGGAVFHYFTLSPPTSTPGGGEYLIKDDDYVHASEVQLRTHVGQSFWSNTGYATPNNLPVGEVYTNDPNNGQVYNHHSAYAPIPSTAINRVESEDNNIGKARDYLTGKLNILKQKSQMQETQMNAATDAEGMIIQQGMKIASLLATLASQISQI